MTAILPREVVDGPARLPLEFGLLSAVTPRTGERWEGGGVTWETLTCEPVGGLSMVQCDPEDMTGYPLDLDRDDAPHGEASSFTVYGHHTCSGPIEIDNAYDRAVEHLLQREEQRVEQALWSGDLGNVPNFAGANDYPAPTDLAGGGGSVLDAVAALEQALAETYGSIGVLHMSRANAIRGISDTVLTVRGGRIQTTLGTPVVAGAGYTDETIVGSGALLVYRSDVFPTDLGAGVFLDRANNNYTALAERTYLIGFDPCGLSSVTLT